MKNKILIPVVLIIILFTGFLVFLVMNPPLYIRGHGTTVEPIPDKEENLYVVAGVNPENHGFANIKLKEVLVNDSYKPVKVELGLSRSNTMVMIAEAVGETRDGFSFHNIEDYPIKTPPKQEYEEGVFDTIREYGIIVYHDEEIMNVLIKYSYLGIPFKQLVVINNGKD